jgi:hypothetical protein
MNIANSEVGYDLIAKTCGCNDKKRKVTYSFVVSAHGLCKDKRRLGMVANREACERLSKYTKDENDIIILENEITQLKLVLDLLH